MDAEILFARHPGLSRPRTPFASPGAGGAYGFSVNGPEFTRPVTQGTALHETLGKITLAAGHHELRIAAQAITGEELFRLRSITLKPVKP